ncbi:hypothetical protein LM700596_160222 [Listeria monocytogenes]|nr:hypothetical protein LM700596_160222 [Listeria monocytogenes]
MIGSKREDDNFIFSFLFYILVQPIHVKKGYTQNIYKTIIENTLFSMYS